MGNEWRLGATLTCVALCAASASAEGEIVHVVTGGGAAGLGLGHSVSGAGDVDGDGLADVIVGFRYGSGLRAGTAQVVSGADGSVLYTFTGRVSFDSLGLAVDGAGDVDGDGFADVIVGATGDDTNGLDSGAAYVYSGRDGSELHRFTGDFARARYGSAVSGAGDVDGDGRADLIVGALPDGFASRPNGYAQVRSGADGSVLFEFVGASSTSRLGCSVDAAGDVDGDGFPDLIAGDWADSTVTSTAGKASVFSGSDGSVIFEVFGDGSGDRLGTVVSGAGDTNGDGRVDVLAGTPRADGAALDLGLVRVYSGVDGSVLHSVRGDDSSDEFGAAAAGVGDYDADGMADFAVGALADDDGGTSAGSVRVYSGADGSVLLRVDGDSAGDLLGASVAGAGDVSGDGGADLILGAPHDDQGGGNRSGAAFIYDGATPASSIARYCTPGPNAFGPGAVIDATGSTSLAANDFVLTVEGARPRRVGLFFLGAKEQQKPFMKGTLCIAPPRYLAGRPIRLDRNGAGQLALSQMRCRVRHRVTGGTTWNFQFIYFDRSPRRRDARRQDVRRSGAPLNLSDAIRVTFEP